MEYTQDTRSLPAVVIHTVILAVTTILALIGNSLVCLAFYRNRRLRTVTNLYVMSLAVADMMVAMFLFPFGAVASGLRRWPFSFNFCHFTGFLAVYWGQVSTWTLALTAINRYFCVVKPLRYSVFFTRKKTILSIVVMWIYLLVQSLSLYAVPVIYRWIPDNVYCRPSFLDEQVEKIFFVFCGCFFIVPMSLVLLGYSKVYWVVKQHNTAIFPSLQGANDQEGTISAQEIKTSRVLFATVFGYCVCWIPFIVILILEYGTQVYIPSYAKSIYPLFAAISSWINPMIYGFMNRSMRREFRNTLFCRKD
ncbi:octopamine receptor beta-2R-like [Oculina patagonica]